MSYAGRNPLKINQDVVFISIPQTVTVSYNPNYYQIVILKGTATGNLSYTASGSNQITVTSDDNPGDEGATFHVVSYPTV